MANEFVSNCPVSWPIKLSGVTPEVNLNGPMFSYQWGLCYDPVEEVSPIQEPIPFGF